MTDSEDVELAAGETLDDALIVEDDDPESFETYIGEPFDPEAG